jgi:hypothetical protein
MLEAHNVEFGLVMLSVVVSHWGGQTWVPMSTAWWQGKMRVLLRCYPHYQSLASLILMLIS